MSKMLDWMDGWMGGVPETAMTVSGAKNQLINNIILFSIYQAQLLVFNHLLSSVHSNISDVSKLYLGSRLFLSSSTQLSFVVIQNICTAGTIICLKTMPIAQ